MAGIGSMVTLHVGIAALQEKNAEWSQYAFKEQYAKAYWHHTTTSMPSFRSSSEVEEGTYLKMGGTEITAIDRWTHHMHKSGQDATVGGRWSWFAVFGKNNAKTIYISRYRVGPRPITNIIGSAYFQQYRIMGQEEESK
jgi:hypothetical protein